MSRTLRLQESFQKQGKQNGQTLIQILMHIFIFIQLTFVPQGSVTVWAIIAFDTAFLSLSNGLVEFWAPHSERLTKLSWWAVQFSTIGSEKKKYFYLYPVLLHLTKRMLIDNKIGDCAETYSSIHFHYWIVLILMRPLYQEETRQPHKQQKRQLISRVFFEIVAHCSIPQSSLW